MGVGDGWQRSEHYSSLVWPLSAVLWPQVSYPTDTCQGAAPMGVVLPEGSHTVS